MGNTIRELPENVRPYEKVMRSGPGGLDDSELLAVVLRTGVKGKNSVDIARDLLRQSGGTLSGLRALSMEELQRISGIGRVKAIEILCLSELAVRFSKSEQGRGPDLSSPGRIASYYMEEMRLLRQEEVRVLFLNTKNRLIATEILSRGSVNASMFPLREILLSALRHDAVNLILLHNHPSGDPEPSEADIDATRSLKKATELLGFSLLDHIVMGDHRYISLREKGCLA